MMSEVIESSLIAETNEDFLSMQYCECLHLLSEHDEKCFGLTFNGTIWIACPCKKAKVLTFHLKIPIEQKDAQTPTDNSKFPNITFVKRAR
jgi:hypothetical protein